MSLDRVGPRRATTLLDDAHDSEIARVQRHLLGAEDLLRTADTSGLTSAQRYARERNIALLRGYHERGVFPRNVGSTDRRPYFVDDRGVPCAVAYLIACSGHDDVVRRVHETRNNAYVAELSDDVGLRAWLEDAGLSLEEAARIQPAYGEHVVLAVDEGAITAPYAAASAGAGLLDVAVVLSNFRASSPSSWRGGFAMGAGAVTFGLGVVKLAEDGDVQKLGIWNTALGAFVVGVGAHAALGAAAGRTTAESVKVRDKQGAMLCVQPMLGATTGMQLVLVLR